MHRNTLQIHKFNEKTNATPLVEKKNKKISVSNCTLTLYGVSNITNGRPLCQGVQRTQTTNDKNGKYSTGLVQAVETEHGQTENIFLLH